MTDDNLIHDMAGKIATIRRAAAELRALAGTGFPAVERNADRILASVKMLELNVTDVIELAGPA
jgi:hypothetical protein